MSPDAGVLFVKKLLCLLLAPALAAALILPAAAQTPPTETPPAATETPAPDYSAFEDKSWEEIVEAYFEERRIKGERVSLGYYNTVTGEEHYYNGDELRTGASIYKLPLTMYFGEMLYLGEIDEETKIGPYTYEDILFHAIRYSSNPAGENMQVWFDSYRDCKTAIGKYLDVEDLPEDSPYFTTNQFSARMMVSCLKYLCAEPERYPGLMDALLTTERGEFLGYGEERYEIAHKLGYYKDEQRTILNDCAVVFMEQPLILVMLTDNIYGGIGAMTGWCTLMCDYADYVASLPLPTPEPTPSPTPTPMPTQAPTPIPPPPSTEDAADIAARKTVFILFCAAALILIAVKLIMDVKKRGPGKRAASAPIPASKADIRKALPFGIAAIFTAALTIGLCIYASFAAPRILGDPGDPAGTALKLMAALDGNDRAAASAVFASGQSPGFEQIPEGAAAQRLWQALWESYSPSLGELRVDGVRAYADVSLTRLDLGAAAEGLRDAVTDRLAEMVEAARLESDVYGEDGQYRPEFVAEALDSALLSLLGDEKYMDTEDFTLSLVYDRGDWLAIWDNELARAVGGGALTGGAGLSDGLEVFANNRASAALDGIAKIEKIYKLPEDTVVAPEPDQSLFGVARTPEEIAELLERAADLLDGQSTTLTPEVSLFGDGGVSYYLDETIFAACWKELIDACVYTFSEVKVAHPSQFRRMIGGNEFGSELLYYPSDMAAGCNAVAALSGDFYIFRNMGVVVHKGQLYRTRGDYIDSCMIDGKGDLNFVYAREIATEQEALDYIAERDIRFSLVFGPVLVDGGEVVPARFYPLGEVKERYSRCGLGQLGELHYLLATANEEAGYKQVPNIPEFAVVLQAHGCVDAYALDGGQTGTLVMNDNVMNRVTYGYQRNISDIIYFATALPEREGAENG